MPWVTNSFNSLFSWPGTQVGWYVLFSFFLTCFKTKSVFCYFQLKPTLSNTRNIICRFKNERGVHFADNFEQHRVEYMKHINELFQQRIDR